MTKKKIIIIFLLAIILLITTLWFSGIIPKQIGKTYGIKYMSENFPDMQLEYINIEWNKYYGDYTITFKDKENNNYGCVIGPKYFPVNLGQGLSAIEEANNKLNIEEVEDKDEIVSFNVTIWKPEDKEKYILNNAKELKDKLESFEYKEEYLCRCIVDYVLESNDGTTYYILSACNGIQKDGKQANITETEMQEIIKYINDNMEEISE